MRCENCHGDFKERDFYSGIKSICKHCAINTSNYQNKMKFIDFCNKHNIPFIGNVYQNSKLDVTKYFKCIFSLSQYRGLGFKGSQFYSTIEHSNKPIENKSFNENVVDNLKQESINIMNKLPKLLETNNYSTHKNLINNLRSMVELINDCDWKFMFSEYKAMYDDEVPQLAIWEQNNAGQIRNHKVFNLEDTQHSIKYRELNEFIEEDAKSLEEYVKVIIKEFEDFKSKAKSDEEEKYYEIKIEAYKECMDSISPLLRFRIEEGY